MRILLAEDDELLGSGLRAGLDQRGFQVDWVRDGVAAERELLSAQHHKAFLALVDERITIAERQMSLAVARGLYG